MCCRIRQSRPPGRRPQHALPQPAAHRIRGGAGMIQSNGKTKTSLPAWKVILRTIIYRRDLWLANWLAMMVTMLFYQIPGLALREFFNSLSGSAQFGLTLWTIIALLFAAEIGSI